MGLFHFLPKFLRIKLIRRRIILVQPPEEFEVKLAITCNELEKAYGLLHDCYVGSHLMQPDPSGLRCNFFSFLPVTTTIVAKVGGEIVGTVSLIKDSPVGLPSDKEFKSENDTLRLEGEKLVEVSSLAIDPKYRHQSNAISLYLMKYLQHYATRYMGCTTVTCVVHPRAKDFYEAFWGFKANKKIAKYKFVNGALGVNLYGNILEANLKKLSGLFSLKEEKNPIQFLFRSDSFLKYPERNIGNHLDPIYTPELLRYFMMKRTRAIEQLTQNELTLIYLAYSQFFENFHENDFFHEFKISKENLRKFRFLVKIDVTLNLGNLTQSCHFIDLHEDGAFLATNTVLNIGDEVQVKFKLGDREFNVTVILKWQNRRTRNNQLKGYGVQFKESQFLIAQILRKTHLSIAVKAAS